MLLPITVPTATPRSPLSVPAMVVASSGADVPAATIVRPITDSAMPNSRATAIAPSTSQSAPTSVKAMPATSSAPDTIRVRNAALPCSPSPPYSSRNWARTARLSCVATRNSTAV